MFFLLHSYGINTTLLKILFLYYFLFTRPKVSISVLEKRLFELSEAPVFIRKNNCFDTFWKLPNKISRLESFLSTFGYRPGKFQGAV